MRSMKRFAFYGRVSTEDQQDPDVVAQLAARALAASHRTGRRRDRRRVLRHRSVAVVAVEASTGSVPPSQGIHANRDRGFDAVVIGEPQRAFYGNQFGLTFPVFVHYDVELWVPEVGGAVDPGSDAHDLVMSLYGGMSKGERNRIKTRVRSAMAAQAAVEGRFLGGRPPYGYRARRRRTASEPVEGRDRSAAPSARARPDCRRQSCNGSSASSSPAKALYAIAEGLTRDGIPSPSAHDPARNRTAKQRRRMVEGRGAIDPEEPSVHGPRSLEQAAPRRGPPRCRRRRAGSRIEDALEPPEHEWVWSEQQTHTAIIEPETLRGRAGRLRQARNAPRSARSGHAIPTCLSGLMRCSQCGRKMQASWNNGRAYYRCKFPAEYAIAARAAPARPSTCGNRRSFRASTSGSAAFSPTSTSTPPAKRWRPSATSTPRAATDAEFELRPAPQGVRRQARPLSGTARGEQRDHQRRDLDCRGRTGTPEHRARPRPQTDGAQAHEERDQSPGAPAQETSSARSPTLTPKTSEPSTTNLASTSRTTKTGESTSPQDRVYSGIVSEGGLVSRRDAIRLTRTVSLAA